MQSNVVWVGAFFFAGVNLCFNFFRILRAHTLQSTYYKSSTVENSHACFIVFKISVQCAYSICIVCTHLKVICMLLGPLGSWELCNYSWEGGGVGVKIIGPMDLLLFENPLGRRYRYATRVQIGLQGQMYFEALKICNCNVSFSNTKYMFGTYIQKL